MDKIPWLKIAYRHQKAGVQPEVYCTTLAESGIYTQV
jgi:hypothetical protein